MRIKHAVLALTLTIVLPIGFQNCSGINSPSGNTAASSSNGSPIGAGSPQLSIGTSTLTEGQSGKIQLSLSALAKSSVTLLWDLSKEDGSSASSDFSIVSGYVDVPAGSGDVVINVVSINDNVYEIADRRFSLRV